MPLDSIDTTNEGSSAKSERRYFGKYRGIVVAVDPALFRLTARVPAVLGDVAVTGWARPCMPFAGWGAGMFGLPLPNSNVWIEFLDGDPDYPIWTGCFFENPADVPMGAALLPSGMGMSTFSGDVVGLADGLGVMLQSGTNTVIINDAGITLSAGGTTSIAINSAGITVTGPGCTLLLNSAGVTVSGGGTGMVVVSASGTTINNGALVVV